MQKKWQVWLEAFRLRTLPLSLSSIILGSFMAYSDGNFNWLVAILAGITTILLQILSNLANDYGDFTNGADNEGRIGPQRTMQSGKITAKEMRLAMLINSALALFFGLWLIIEGTSGLLGITGVIFLVLGMLAIAAAIKYTVGKSPYGYYGLGDLFVFIFFGVVGVMGTYFLHTGFVDWSLILPAASVGLLSTAVLNLNNLRDHENDAKSGKNTIVVKMGFQRAKIYHAFLLSIAVLTALVFVILHFSSAFQLLFLMITPVLMANLKKVFTTTQAQLLDPELKKIALSTFVFALLFGIGHII